jgi:hypothetical protein
VKGYLLIGVIIGASIICATAISAYLSPFQTCMRELRPIFHEDAILHCIKR